MLKARILTALVVLPLFLSALFFLQDIFWAIVLLSLTVIGSREWSRLAGFSVKNTIVFMLLTTVIGGELLFQLSESLKTNIYSIELIWFYGLSAAFWIIAVPPYLKQLFTIKQPFILMLIGCRLTN